jgi:hypothetical protein
MLNDSYVLAHRLGEHPCYLWKRRMELDGCALITDHWMRSPLRISIIFHEWRFIWPDEGSECILEDWFEIEIPPVKNSKVRWSTSLFHVSSYMYGKVNHMTSDEAQPYDKWWRSQPISCISWIRYLWITWINLLWSLSMTFSYFLRWKKNTRNT